MADSDNESLNPQQSEAKLKASDSESADSKFFSDDEEAKTVVEDLSSDTNQAASNPSDLLDAQLAEWKSKVVYLSAEIENMRKRFARERADLIKMAGEEALKGLLPVFDNISYALKAAKEAPKADVAAPVLDKLLQGVEMTLKHFEQTLVQQGVSSIPTVGTAFDPTMHEAVGQTQVAEFENDVVSTEVQKGFRLHSRVLRPARVLVNKK